MIEQLALFVFGFFSGRYVWRAIFGTATRIALALTVLVVAADSAAQTQQPPQGFGSSYTFNQVGSGISWGGSATFDATNSSYPNGSWKKVLTSGTYTGTWVLGRWHVGNRWAVNVTVNGQGTWNFVAGQNSWNSQPWEISFELASSQPTGSWTTGNVGSPSVIQDFAIDGDPYARAGLPLLLQWHETDTFMRSSTGLPVAPTEFVQDWASFPRLMLAVPQPNTSNVSGWAQAAVDWSASNRLASLTTSNYAYFPGLMWNGSGYTLGSIPWTSPRRWHWGWIELQNFGGYAFTTFDVDACAYTTTNGTYYYVVPGSSDQSTASLALYGIQSQLGYRERWTVVASTESGTFKPYIELRKPGGIVLRYYALGHALDQNAVFNRTSDGTTYATGMTQQLSGFMISWNSAATAANYWPGKPLVTSSTSQPSFDPGASGVDRVADFFDGSGSSTQPSMIEQIAEAGATSRPSFIGGWDSAAPETFSPAEAEARWMAVADYFGIGVNYTLSLQSGDMASVGTWQEWLYETFFTMPGQVTAFLGPLAGLFKWFGNISVVSLTGWYVWYRVWWGIGARNPEQSRMPANPLPEAH